MGVALAIGALVGIWLLISYLSGKADRAIRNALDRRGSNKEDKRRRDLLG